MTPSLSSDRYEIVRPIGAGTHGQVFEAVDRHTGEHVALKHIRRTATGPTTGLNEFAAILAVQHPGIVRCLDFHYLGTGDTCLVYEYVAGGTLRGLMTEDKPVTAELWDTCARDLLAALEHLHQSQLLHCDLKPENILCEALPDGRWRFKLSDLGVARFLSHRATLEYAATPAGAPGYMAPESFYQQFSAASDLYSLGVILFELATGRRPFEGDIRAIARSHLQTQPPLELVKVPAQSELIRWLLHKNPAARPPSSAAVLQRLAGLAPDPTDTVTAAKRVPALPAFHPLEAYEFDQEFFLNSLSRQHLPLTLHGKPALAAVYDSHLELFDAVNGRPLNRFIPQTAGILQLRADSSLLSAEPRRLVLWEGDYRMPRNLLDIDGHARAAALDTSGQLLVWIEQDRAFVRLLADHSPLHHVDCPTSGLRPRLLASVIPLQVILIPGTTRPDAIWIDADGRVAASRPLPGPVIDSSHTLFPSVFCATPSDLGSTGLTLVIFGAPGELTLIPFDEMPRFHSFCEDGLVIGTADGCVTFVSQEGRRRPLGRIDDAGCTLLFSPRREFYFTLNETGHRRRFQLYRLP
jgi:serine/threonine protein kinase